MEKYTNSLPSVEPIARSEPEPAIIETVIVEQEEATATEEEEITATEEQSLNPKRRGSGSGTSNMQQQVITSPLLF